MFVFRETEERDPGYIVIDEAAGIFLGCSVLALIGTLSPLQILINFILFRVFDIFKIRGIRQLEAKMSKSEKTAAIGIMLDDILAAILSTVTQVAAVLIIARVL
jgi:phosphatidylglycerophosphatase A